jgi:putative addiction module killer protein
MIEVRQTQEFSAWLHRLSDANAVARIVARIRRMEHGNPGDTRSVGEGIPGNPYRPRAWLCIYYLPRGRTVILLCGGDKRRQRQDIKRAQMLAESL